MKRELQAVVALLATALLSTLVCASEKKYEAGKLVSVNSPGVPITLPPLVPSGPSITFPTHPFYEFEIHQGDVLYIGICQKRGYKAEWRVGDDVHFRLQKDKIYLKRPIGKEFQLDFTMEAKPGPDGKPFSVASWIAALISDSCSGQLAINSCARSRGSLRLPSRARDPKPHERG